VVYHLDKNVPFIEMYYLGSFFNCVIINKSITLAKYLGKKTF